MAFDWGGVAKSASDSLEELVARRFAENLALRRQAEIERASREAEEIRRQQIEEQSAWRKMQIDAMNEARAAAAEQKRQQLALGVAGTLTPNDDIDEDTAKTLREGGLGVLVTSKPGAVLPVEQATTGLPQALGGDAPQTLPTFKEEVVPGKTTFRGTAAQRKEQEQRQRLEAFLKRDDVPEHVRAFLQAQYATGDESLPADLFKPKEEKHSAIYTEYQDYKREVLANGGTPVSFEQYQSIDANRKKPVTNVQMGGLTQGQVIQAGKWADDYRTDSKDFITRAEAYGTVRAAASDPSAAGDLSLIFAYMKMLDPGSVVREGEFATAQNAAGVPERIRNTWNNALRGTRLSPAQRKDFLAQAKNIYGTSKKRQDRIRKTYEDRAHKFGIPTDLVVMDYGVDDTEDAPMGGGAVVNTNPRYNPATGKVE